MLLCYTLIQDNEIVDFYKRWLTPGKGKKSIFFIPFNEDSRGRES